MDKLKRKVPIKNVLYMFSYIWDKVESQDFTNLDNKDDFDSANILSELFLNNVYQVIKKGLYKEYNEKEENIRGIKGKINFKDSINSMAFQNARAVCIYDELEENNLINQIIKTTALKLFRTNEITDTNKNKLNNILLYFNKVDVIDIKNNSFDIKFNRNNNYTYYLILVCKLINSLSMLSEDKGLYKFIDILDNDEFMANIFEMFIYKFYEWHLYKKSKMYDVSYQKILKWETFSGNTNILPIMKLDILLDGITEDQTLIIDTKYYSQFLASTQWGTDKLKTGNLYQMYTYLNHIDSDKKIRGMLLYPFNGERISEKYEIDVMNKNEMKKATLEVQTIDLSQKWQDIENTLLNLV